MSDTTATELIPYEHDENFLDKCICKVSKKGEKTLDPDKSVNYCTILQHHWMFKDLFAYDEFDLEPKLVRCPDWYDKRERDAFRVRAVVDEDVIQLDYQMQKIGMNGSTNRVYDAILVASKNNPMHPVRDYFNRLEWDGINRLDKWLTYYLGAEADDADYLSAAGKKWLTAGVARVMDPGCKFDNMLILEGEQGSYKSTALRVLSTFKDGDKEIEYFTDDLNISKADDADELKKLSGKLIIEIAELDGFYKREDTFLKAFISRQTDRYRPSYGRTLKTFPRQFILGGTYNPKGGVFKDPTGARRFWPVKVGKISIAALKHDREQLWAEAVHCYKAGEDLWLNEALADKASEAAAKRRIVDAWDEDVMDACGSKDFVQIRDIMKHIGLDINKRTSVESARISDLLRSRGWIYDRKKRAGKMVWGWTNPLWVDHMGIREEPPMPDPDDSEPDYEYAQQEIINGI